jgi:hypothetical protein
MLKKTLSLAVLGVALAAWLVLAPTGKQSNETRAAAAPEVHRAAMATPAVLPRAPSSLPARSREDLLAVELAVQKARARGDGEGEAYRLRAASLSAQTIAMLTERELAEQAWMQRVAAWRAQTGRTDAAGQQALRERLFSPEEQTRLQAYEVAETPTLKLH